MRKPLLCLAVFSMTPIFLNNCGSSSNIFHTLAPGSGKDGARSSFSQGDYDKAINQLESYLKDHPGDAEALSMLATARMKKAGIDQLQIALKITELQKVDGKGEWQSLLSAMPAGSQDNVNQLTQAVAHLSQIPASQRTQEQNYQLGIAQTALAVAVTKQTVGDPSGNSIDKNKVDSLSDSDAQLILDSLQGSNENISQSGSTSQGASSMSSLSGKIASSQGNTQADKLRNFLKST